MIETAIITTASTIFKNVVDNEEIYRITGCRNIVINILTLRSILEKGNHQEHMESAESIVERIYQDIAVKFTELFKSIDYSNDLLVNREEVNLLLKEFE